MKLYTRVKFNASLDASGNIVSSGPLAGYGDTNTTEGPFAGWHSYTYLLTNSTGEWEIGEATAAGVRTTEEGVAFAALTTGLTCSIIPGPGSFVGAGTGGGVAGNGLAPRAHGVGSVAVGAGASAFKERSVALGVNSQANTPFEVCLGAAGYPHMTFVPVRALVDPSGTADFTTFGDTPLVFHLGILSPPRYEGDSYAGGLYRVQGTVSANVGQGSPAANLKVFNVDYVIGYDAYSDALITPAYSAFTSLLTGTGAPVITLSLNMANKGALQITSNVTCEALGLLTVSKLMHSSNIS